VRVAVLAPMPMELRPFSRALKLSRAGRDHVGTVGFHDVAATLIGLGTARAAQTAERMIKTHAPDRLVLIGIAGGIDTRLPIGTVITPEVIVDGATGTEFRPPPWDRVVARRRIISYDDFEVEMQVMSSLQAQGYAAVDMETSGMARVCEQRGCPYTVFRAISDNATDRSVDAATAGMLQPNGSPDVGAALRYMVRRPWHIPQLVKLGRDSQLAARAASTAAIAALRD
jgi:adenosylhomocysteine nucleosidase